MRRLLVLPILFACPVAAQQPSERNVVFGTHSGLALLMDVYKPVNSNGYGIVVIPGSGWHRGLGYDAVLLKESKEFLTHVQKLNGAGYTTFVITHRAAPRFRFPAAVEDAQRAARFVRQHASRYGVDKDRLGALGGSSGGHLVSMLGTLDGKGDPEDPDPVQRQSSKVQCVVALFPVTDLAKVNTPNGLAAITSFMGMPAPRGNPTRSRADGKAYWEASPVNHVTADDPPFLLIHGDGDKTVPYNQSELLEAGLKQAGVKVKLVRVPGGGHGPSFPGAAEKADWAAMALQWFDTNLKKSRHDKPMKATRLLLPLLMLWSAAAQDRPGLFFREDWKETPAATPVTQEHVANPQVLVSLYGPGKDLIKKSHHDRPADDPYYVWSGDCKANWAVSLRHKDAYVDLTGLGKVRWRSKQAGFRELRLVLKLANGAWIVSDQSDGPSVDWRQAEFNIGDLRWRRLDIKTVVEGAWVDKPDLSRVDEIGWTDLMAGGGSVACSRLDWIEVDGKRIPRKGEQQTSR